MDRHYDVLGVSSDADRAEIRRAYRTLLKEHHPDQGGSRERFLRIKRAYEAVIGERTPGGERGDDTGPGPDLTYDPEARDGGVGGERGREHGHGLCVEGDLLTVTLSGLVRNARLGALLKGGANPGVRRTVAFFRVRNESDRPLEWRGRTNTNFVGDDGFLYEGSNILVPHADHLPRPWCASDHEVPPGRALDAIVVAGEIPESVRVDQVVYTQHAYDRADGRLAETERYLFEIRPRIREALAEGALAFDFEFEIGSDTG